MLSPADLFSMDGFGHEALFEVKYVWDILKEIGSYINETIEPNVDVLRERGDVLPETVILHNERLIDSDFDIRLGSVAKGKVEVKYRNEVLRDASVIYASSSFLSNNIQLGKGIVIEPGALMKDGIIIGDRTEVRQGAYLRGSCLVGDRCVVGHTTEAKNAVFMDDAKAGHFAYVGDSILGNNVNLGAGTKLANLKMIDSLIVMNIEKQRYDTGLRKFGAVIGDRVETGCNTVTSPGTILGTGSMVFSNTTVRPGYYPPRSLVR